MAQWDDALQTILNDPQTMGQLFSIAQSISGQDASTQEEPMAPPVSAVPPPAPPSLEGNPLSALGGLGDLDPKLLSIGLTMLSALQQENTKGTQLLESLQPYLSEKHKKHMDKALQMAKYARLLSTAYELYREEKEGDHV